ncbi:MAG TPA: STAS domain-containing protein, partial [Bacillota bacterium]|nr:STAS domain-containing protein [Bacillota bacterium]
MEITRTVGAEQVELKLKGRMDATWSDHVARALAECMRSGQHNLVVDMAQVDYISSAGLRVLVLYARQLKAIQGRLGVVHASSIVRKVLELAGLDALLLAPAGPPAPSAPAIVGAPGRVALAELGATAEVFELDPEATLRVQSPGDAA